LTKLKHFSASASEGSGFSEGDLVAYLLVGDAYEPELSPYTLTLRYAAVRLPSGVTLRRPRLQFELTVRDVTWSELRRNYREARSIFNALYPPFYLTQKEDRLRKAVNSFGGRPGRASAGAAWAKIAERAGYPTAQAARVAYARIVAKQQAATRRPASLGDD
jgi:hypothetical protein